MKKIAFFDFDGTITTKDTLLEFIKFSKGALGFYTGFLVSSPYLVAFKLRIISNQLAKEKVLAYFFRNMPVKVFQDTCERFAREKLPSLIRPKAMEEIANLKAQNVEVVIVSASPNNWIRSWSEQHQLELIATILQTENGLITGKIEGKNCHGTEKITRIRKKYDLSQYSEIYAYGDSAADLPMLSLAGYQHMKPFR